MAKKILTLLIVALAAATAGAQSLDEILLHFPEEDMAVPMALREKMVEYNGNTRADYQNYKLVIYDRKTKFARIVTPFDNIYEICVWKLAKDTLMVGLCETICGESCRSAIRFFLPSQNWTEVPAEVLLPELALDDIFSEKKLEKNYYTVSSLMKDFQLKVQMQLPQVGNDIMVVFSCLDELEKSEYQRIFKYLDGTMLDFVWSRKDRVFTKSSPYFLNN